MISKKTKYGLKALSYLAKQEPNIPVSILEIATTQNISQKFLEAILLDLKKRGFLGSKKGKGGGYYLLKPAKEISVAAVFRVLEGPIAWLPCVSLNYYEKCNDCTSEETCDLNRMMVQVRDNILAVVENKSIADI
ncbi:MAG: Rrf2 family transcriptional regulator [Crocinitomicaceae bacterium]|jgi:Rrf2 family protein|nr:Rrf2 family transcriptional regulator [Crocinitomicaceae bacterium]